eukprot:5094875-Prymnesium_polylepis.1
MECDVPLIFERSNSLGVRRSGSHAKEAQPARACRGVAGSVMDSGEGSPQLQQQQQRQHGAQGGRAGGTRAVRQWKEQ